ncbi:MAG TPA: cytochrome c [Gaiellaceae bacterium]|nr:cytochrome c [Gaiellaceae bacterium]
MLLALTGYETALLVVAAVFIAFALTVALAIPRTRPEFPGGRLGIFLVICVALFAAQMTAVLVLAEVGEADEPAHEEAAPPGETTGTETTTPGTTETETRGTEPAETTTETTDTTATTDTTEAAGDPVAGKEVFLTVAQPSCGGCHTLSDAGTSGSVGPNLDAASPSYDKVVERVTDGQGVMPSFAGSLNEQQIQDVAAYVSSVAGG